MPTVRVNGAALLILQLRAPRLFAPHMNKLLLAYAGLRHLLAIPPIPAFGASLIWLILPWGFALLNPDRQFLYDFLAGTRLVDLKQETSES